MSSSFGEAFRVTVFGESHGAGIGAVAEGFPAGEHIDEDALARFMARRAGGKSFSTQRREADSPRFLGGIKDGVLTGAPLSLFIDNASQRSSDYKSFENIPRPSHADYPMYVKYGGYADRAGGGHFSGRLTAAICAVGGMAKQILARRGIYVGAHAAAIAGVRDAAFDPLRVTRAELEAAGEKEFPALDDSAAERMLAAIASARAERDSVGGTVECAAVGLPTGLGEPLSGGVENRLSAAMFTLGAVRGIEFGDGFAAAEMRGSEHNDGYGISDGRVTPLTNHAGGVLGGMTTGAPLLFRVAFKPTPSISKPQRSVDLASGSETELVIAGRHDPCIVPRAVPCVEAVTACVLLDLILGNKGATENGTL